MPQSFYIIYIKVIPELYHSCMKLKGRTWWKIDGRRDQAPPDLHSFSILPFT